MAETVTSGAGAGTGLRAVSLRRRMALATLAGGLGALAQAPFNLWPLGLIGLACLFALFRSTERAKPAFWIGWAGGTGYFAVALNWIVEPFLVEIARYGWMAPFALVFLAGGLALFWGAAFVVAGWANGRARSGALAWIAALTGAELLRSYIFTGFPWALIGYTLSASPAAQYAAFIGPHGLTVFALICAVSLWRLARPGALLRRALPATLCALLLVAALPLSRPVAPAPDAPIIRLVQPNAPQREKWDPAHITTFFRRQIDYTAAPPNTAPPALIVWPETAIPWLLRNADDALSIIAAAAKGTPVILGLRRLDGARLLNSAVLLTPDGAPAAIYDKYHLVPFGEYMPLGDFLTRFGIHGLAAREGHGYSAGPGPTLMTLPGIGPALPLICYEAVFPQDVGAAPARPRLLLQITNDAWFGRFSGPFQHLQQARMRAIEQGLPMVRVANTGVSAMIGPHGIVQRQIPLGTQGFVDAPLPPALPPTLYARTGDWPALILVIAALGGAVLRRRRFPIDPAQPTA
jgi:apolipoprotein N-acyltransferase